MKKTFNAKAAQAAGVDVLKRHFNPHADAYLLLGQVKDTSEYFVAWQSRHKEKLVDGAAFTSKTAAVKHYRELLDDGEPSDHHSLKKDFQKAAVYDWEDFILMPYSKKIDEAGARALLTRIARDHGVPVPKLKWGKAWGVSSYADDEIQLKARDNITLLHEMAHHIHEYESTADDDLPHHSPGFVAVAIRLYHQYADIDLDFLGVSACSKEILGDSSFSRHILATIETDIGNRGHGGGRARKSPQQPQIAA